MRNKLAWWLTLGWWAVALFLGHVGAQSQGPQARQPEPPRPLPPSVQQAGFATPPAVSGTLAPGVDLSQLPPAAQEVYRSGRSGAEWLCRVHQPSGRFLPGWLPDL